MRLSLFKEMEEIQTVQEVVSQEHYHELLPSLLSVGFGPGAVVSVYLSSGGFFDEVFHSPSLFAGQALFVSLASVLVVASKAVLDDRVDEWLGVERAWPLRTATCGMLAALCLLCLPFVQSPVPLLLVGAGCSSFAVCQSASGTKLASALLPGGSNLVALGTTLGGVTPLAFSYMVGYEPGCKQVRTSAYFGAAALISMASTWYWMRQQQGAEEVFRTHSENQEETSSLLRSTEEGDRGPVAEYVAQVYLAIGPGKAPRSEGKRSSLFHVRFPENAFYIFIATAAGFWMMALFPLAAPLVVHQLFLLKCLGDFLGRASALLQIEAPEQFITGGRVARSIRALCVSFVLMRLTISVVLARILYIERCEGLHLLTAFLTLLSYTTAGYAAVILDTDAQLRATGPKERSIVAEQNMLMSMMGQVLGQVVALIMQVVMPQ